MSLLIIWPDSDPAAVVEQTADPAGICAALSRIGCRFEQRPVRPDIGPASNQDAVLAAYRDDVDQIVSEYGFVAVDVAAQHPAVDPDWAAAARELRAKFADEHTHGDDHEVRFIVRGSGVFYLHAHGRVYAVQTVAGDLISVPPHTTHWFDMGPVPDFTTIRFFRNQDGWVAFPTGSDIAGRFPDADTVQAWARALGTAGTR
jgi:1,2-dihydroxy-3-keto-5-methylthiopentene dioxygenase